MTARRRNAVLKYKREGVLWTPFPLFIFSHCGGRAAACGRRHRQSAAHFQGLAGFARRVPMFKYFDDKMGLYSFLMYWALDFSISRLVPTPSKAISSSTSPPIFWADSTMPCPNALWDSISPFW